MNLRKLFGEKLKELRESRGLTQEMLAEMIDMQPSSIAHIETGNRAPSFDTLEMMSKKMNIDYSEFFTFLKFQTDNDLAKTVLKIINGFDKNTLIFAIQFLESLEKFSDKRK